MTTELNVGFESYREDGSVILSTKYPMMSHQVSTVINTVLIDPYNSVGVYLFPDGPILATERQMTFSRPRTPSAYMSGVDGASAASGIGNTSKYIKGLSILGQTWDFKPFNSTWDVLVFQQKMKASGANFGMQSYAPDGTLLFDSETPAFEIIKVTVAGDWSYDGKRRRNGPQGSNGWDHHFYSTSFPIDADGFAQIANYRIGATTNITAGGASYGCESLARLTAMVVIDLDYPFTIAEPPRVMFARKSR